MSRNRSQGWKYAKESGHVNERMMSIIVAEPPHEISNLMYENEVIISSPNHAGASQKKEISVLGHKTTPKLDNIILTNLREFNISLKKSRGGQAFLISSDNFFNGLEKMYHVKVPDGVIKIMKLFTGEDNEGVKEALKNEEVYNKNQKCSKTQRDRRLNGEALLIYNPQGVSETMNFLTENIEKITKMVFSTGLVENIELHAEYLYYKNLINKSKSADTIFYIQDIVEKVSNKTIKEFGPKNGGTTILLPFGHLQMHKGMIQFHHNYKKIQNLFE